LPIAELKVSANIIPGKIDLELSGFGTVTF
jgi:hypothetical protein